MSSKLVCNVGFNSGKYPATKDGKILKVYNLWHNLICRCYHPRTPTERPTYVGCSISEKFKDFSFFHEWCLTQIGFGQEGYQLDKDLLLKGNKVYSEDTCVFLPRDLNSLLLSSKAARGSLPLGVSAVGTRFRVHCGRKPANRFVGDFKTPEEAFQAYKQAKETFIKSQAEKWKDQIDIRAYEALMRYEVLPTD